MKALFGSILLLIVAMLTSCDRPRPAIVRSFYYWKNDLRQGDLDTAFLRRQVIRRLYVRCLDVDWTVGRGAVPVAEPRIEPGAVPIFIGIVPVVYIVNSVFLQVQTEQEAEALAEKIAGKWIAFTRDSTLRFERELQIDCDWSGKTRDAYFIFLQKLKQKMAGATLSVTIRLHQYKNRGQTGIPPADRGMLMLYNILPVRHYQVENSIFDISEIDKYLDGEPPYPLSLDCVLPLFSWGVVYRNEKFVVLLNNMRQNDLDYPAFLKKNAYFWKVVRDTVYGRTYLRYGDEIKLETVEPDALHAMTRRLRSVITADTAHLAFYHFDQDILPYYEEAFFEETWEYLQ